MTSQITTSGSVNQPGKHKVSEPSHLRVPAGRHGAKNQAPNERKKPDVWRAIKLVSLQLAKSLRLFTLARLLTKGDVRILCYHGIWLGEDQFAGDSMFMSASEFARRLEIVKRLGMRVVSLADAVAAFEGKGKIPGYCIVITIDDGWYSTYKEMLPLLKRHKMPATIYCDTANLQRGLPIPHVMASYLLRLTPGVRKTERLESIFAAATNLRSPAAERLSATKLLAQELNIDISRYLEKRVFDYMTPGELREAARAGVDIQLHTHNHTLGDHFPGTVRDEIETNRRALVQLLGGEENRFCHFAYPSGEHRRQSADTLEQLGIASSTTLEFGLASPHTSRQMLPRFTDGEQVSELEFEAFLSGFMEIVRPFYRALSSVKSGLGRSVDSAL